VAVLADRLGRLAGFTYPDLAFTAGLLHDLGKVVVATSLDAAGALLEHPLPEHGLHSVEAERAYLGTDHTELGELLALKWRLPKEIGGAARWHHAPLEAPAATLRYLATVVQVADTAAHVAGFGDSADQSAELDRDALERLNLEPTQVMEAIEQGKAEIERTREMMRHARPTHLRAVA
jgi:HD-like signal output (HDOD) protein